MYKIFVFILEILFFKVTHCPVNSPVHVIISCDRNTNMGLPSIFKDVPFKQVKVAQSCPILCDPMYYTVHEILQARILEWVAFSFSRGIFPTQGSNPGLLHCRQSLCQLSHKGSSRTLEWVHIPSPADLPDPGIEPGTWLSSCGSQGSRVQALIIVAHGLSCSVACGIFPVLG